MPLTLEQITAELTAQPEVKKTLISSLKTDFLDGLRAEGTIVRTKDEETTFLTNYENNIIPGKVQAQIGEKIKAVHDQYDADILELTGLKKGSNEKTYEFNKRVLKDLKEKAESAAAGGDTVLKDKVKDLEAKLRERENFVSPDDVNNLKKDFFTKQLGFRISSVLEKADIAVPAHITDEKQKKQFIETQRRFIQNDFLSRFTAKEDEQGNIVFYEKDKLLTNGKTASPLTEADLITANYAGYFVPEKKPKSGAGSGGSGESGGGDANEASLKTKKEVMDHLKTKGLVSGGADFNKEYSRIIKEYGITDPGE